MQIPPKFFIRGFFIQFNKQTFTLAAFLILALNTSAATTESSLKTVYETAKSNPACTKIHPFYWEVGNARGVLASGNEGRRAPDANTEMPIASATKWLFGAYVAQVRNGKLNQADIEALTMRTGYTSYQHRLCVKVNDSKQARMTVAECFTQSAPLAGRNDALSADEMGKFHYGGGHFQFWAVQNGLSDLTRDGLAQEMNNVLGHDLHIQFKSPQLAGGARMSGAHYGLFLQKLLKGQLVLGRLLGEHAVCTVHNDCPDKAEYAPLPHGLHWKYSLGHWVEVGSNTSDGAFSSAGAFGFYPWISADKQSYGLIARHKKSLIKRPAPSSAACGMALRNALASSLHN